MSEHFQYGDDIIIKGTITRSGGSSSDDIYSSKESKKSFDVRDHINPETAEVASQAGQSVVQSIASQASSMGLSGCIAMGSGVYFQADAVADNWIEAVEVAQPMVNELIETGTINETLPEDSKYIGVEIPTTTSFLGMKVGEERKKQQAYDALTPEEKQLQENMKKMVDPTNPKNFDTDGSPI